jgi:hypothetical protein
MNTLYFGNWKYKHIVDMNKLYGIPFHSKKEDFA